MSRKLTYDRTLFAAAMLILVFGLVMIYSASAMIASQKEGIANPYHFLVRQVVWAIAGGVAMLLLMHLDLNRLRTPVVLWGMLIVLVAALVAVLFQGAVNGTHRWILLPWFQVQPSELAKPVLILFLASYLAQREDRINDITGALLPLISVLALVAGLIVLQPDFGTAVTLVVVAATMLFIAGLSWGRVIAFAIVAIPVAAALLLSADYRRERLLSFLNPEADPLGKGFQAMQSLIAIGTGGMTGLGIGNGRQKLFFLPEPHTDFIFSIVGEELGFAGAFLLIVVFGILIWRGLRVAERSQDRFTFYAALGVTLMIAFQVLINISVTLCLLPTKGLPLPLVSYGGSSLIASMMLLGILLNLSQKTG
jgi:cell division protein FtsW